jgi:hypothetical protein
VDGTDRKADQYWAFAIEEYTKSISFAARETKIAKIHWDWVKKPVSEFHGCWVHTNGVYKSGYSDER